MYELKGSGGLWRFVGLATTVPGIVFLFLPLALILWMSFFSDAILVFPPTTYSTEWYVAAAQQKSFVDGFVLSLQVAILATAIAVSLGAAASVFAARRPTGQRAAILAVLTSPLIVPAIALGTAIYLVLVEIEVASGVRLAGNFAGLVLAHSLIALPWVVRLLTAALLALDNHVEEAAVSLGAHPVKAFLRVTVLSLRPALIAASLFGFVTSFGNLEMSLFLVSPGAVTLPIATLQYLEWRLDPTVAAAAVLQVLIVVAAMFLTSRFVRLSTVVA